jgi:hypothetical protein
MIPAAHIRPVAIARKITIRPHGNGRFRVGVEPRLDREPPPVIYNSRTDAVAHVAGLQMARGWPVTDFTKGE